MNRSSAVALTALLFLAGCAGARTPRLVRCTGPYRYANPYGTVLPTLPIPGQPSPAVPPTAASSRASGPVPVPDPTAPSPPPAAGHPDPGKKSGLAPDYPSC